MKCSGDFVFKSIEQRASGQFTALSGQIINYPACYIVKADEVTNDNKINERKFKIDVKNSSLISRFKELESYTKCEFEFDVEIGSNGRVNINLVDFTNY